MIDWLKKLFSGETKDEQGSMDKARTTQVSGNKGATASSVNAAVHMELSSRIQAMLEEKGPQTAFQALLKEFFEGINNSSAVEYFSAYYEGQCSKKDILDKYDFLVKVEQDTLEGIASLGKQLGDGYEPLMADVLSMVDEFYKTEDTFCIYDKEFFAGVVGELISGQITPKQVQSKLWSKYFNFVKVFLDIGKKVGLATAEQAASNPKTTYEPVDEIEATLIKLLEAEDKAKAAVLKSK